MLRKGVAATDLTYLMGKNFDTEFRRANEEALLGAYLDELYLNGVRPESYTMEMLRYHYTRGVFYVFMIWVVSEAELGGGPDKDFVDKKGKTEGPEEEADDRGAMWTKISTKRVFDLVLEKRAKTLMASILEDTLFCVPSGRRRDKRRDMIEKLDSVGRPGRIKIPKKCRVMPPGAYKKYKTFPQQAPTGPTRDDEMDTVEHATMAPVESHHPYPGRAYDGAAFSPGAPEPATTLSPCKSCRHGYHRRLKPPWRASRRTVDLTRSGYAGVGPDWPLG